jgi:hypothetical protein
LLILFILFLACPIGGNSELISLLTNYMPFKLLVVGIHKTVLKN